MKTITRFAEGAAMALALTLGTAAPAMAQESSYKPGSVFVASSVKVMPGQFENYMDYLAGRWKTIQEFGKKEGVILSYRVLAVNNAREGEPTLILLIEYKDYAPNAQREALSKKLDAYLKENDRSVQVGVQERQKLRETLGTMELQELILK